MTSYQINKSGIDTITLEIMQSGSYESSVNLKHNLLDDRKDYYMAVEQLSLPLNNVPLCKTGEQLFQIRRRNVGGALGIDADTLLTFNATANQAAFTGINDTYTLARNFYDVSSVIRDLNSFARGFEQIVALAGITDLRLFGGVGTALNPGAAVIAPLEVLAPRNAAEIAQLGTYPLLKFRLGVDGTMIIDISPNMMNNFYFEFTRYGAEVLGLSPHVKTVEVPTGAAIGLPQTRNIHILAISRPGLVVTTNSDAFVGNALAIIIGGVLRQKLLYSENSLYQCLDTRVKVSVSTHLPITSNVEIMDEKETINREICEVFFQNNITSSVEFDNSGHFVRQTIENKVYTGLYPFVQKHEPIGQWHKLKTSYELRFFRFHVHVWRRTYDSIKDTWNLKKENLSVPADKFWNMTLRFISET